MRHPLRSTATLGVGGLASLIAAATGQCGAGSDSSRADTVAYAGPAPAVSLVRVPGTVLLGSYPVTPISTLVHPSPADIVRTIPALAPLAPTPTAAPTAAPIVVPTAPPTAPPATDVAAAPTAVVASQPPTSAAVATEPPPPPATDPPTTEPPPTEPVVPTTEAPAPSPSPPAGSTSEAVHLANEQRVAAGVPALASDDGLTSAARSHSIDQATMQSATHTGSDGSSPADRVAEAGFTANASAENVAAGYGTAAAVIDGWMGSGPHRDNLLNPAYTSIGVASAEAGDGTFYWTMVLAG